MISIPATVGLSVVAVIGYMVGRWQKYKLLQSDLQSRREIKRAQTVVRELEEVAREIRKSLAKHHSSVARFKDRMSRLAETSQQDSHLQDLFQEVDDVLGPTLLLANDLARAYDQIRRQGNQLMSFVEVRTDQLTGICNRRAMDDTLNSLVAMHNRYDLPFSIVMFDVDYFKKINDEHGHVAGDQVLRNVAQTLDHAARETDIVARYGGEEFAILMPQTQLHGAAVFAERVRQMVATKLNLTVSGGVAMAIKGQNTEAILQQADHALYESKANGRNLVSINTPEGIRTAAEFLDDRSETERPLATVA